MLRKIKVILLIIMISFLGNKVTANYEKLAYDFHFKDLHLISASVYASLCLSIRLLPNQQNMPRTCRDLQKSANGKRIHERRQQSVDS